MNFGKAKKILIFLFAFLNLFLIFQLTHLSDSRTTLSTDSIKKTVQLVSSSGIKVLEDAIPRRIEILSFLELSNPLYDKEQFISEFSSYQKNETDSKAFKIYFNSPSSQNEKEILKFLNKSGFSHYSLKFGYKISNPIKQQSIFTYHQSYNSYPIYGSLVNVTVDKNMLSLAEGNVYKINNVNINDYKPISPLQILLSLSRSLNGKQTTVKAIKQGYFIPSESKNYQNITAVPCYIFNINGHKFLFDAEKGIFLLCYLKNGTEIADISVALSSL